MTQDNMGRSISKTKKKKKVQFTKSLLYFLISYLSWFGDG